MTTMEASRRIPGRPATVRSGQTLSAFFVACYAGLIIPVVGVGVLAGFTGTFTAVLTFSVLLVALGLLSISRFVARGAR